MGTFSILAFASDPRRPRGCACWLRLGLLLITGMSPADRRGSLKAASTVFAAPTKLPSAGLPRASLLRISGATVGAAGARATTGPRGPAAAPTARFPGLASLAAQHNRAGAGGYFLVACAAHCGAGALLWPRRTPAGRQRRPPRRATKTRIALRRAGAAAKSA
jgi:hypothetical protein